MNKVSLSLHSLPPDPQVKNTHDTHRDIKGNHGGKDGHDLVSLNELYIALTLLNLPFTLKAFC